MNKNKMQSSISKSNSKIWNKHYKKAKANQFFPDEEVVRYFAHLLRDLPQDFFSYFPQANAKGRSGRIPLLDFGAGSGRNGLYLSTIGFDVYFNDYALEAIKLCEKKWKQNYSEVSFVSFVSLKTRVDTAVNKKVKLIKKIPRFYAATKKSVKNYFPYPANSFAVVLAWGVLHYNAGKEEKILKQIQNLLIPGGRFFGTLRAEGDTHLQLTSKDVKNRFNTKAKSDFQNKKIKLKSLQGADARLYTKSEVLQLFKNFKSVRIAYMQRSVLGNLDTKICHWIVEAVN